MSMKKHSILVVDDEESILRTVSRELKKAGYEVTMAASGAEAIEKLKMSGYDLLITDLLMETFTGIDVMLVAKELHPAIKMVAITGFSYDDSLAQAALRSGVMDIITKPYDRKEFLLKIAGWLGNPDQAP